MANTSTATTLPTCADGCGAELSSPKSRFRQGHDQRLVSVLAEAVTVGKLDAHSRKLLGLAKYSEAADIQDRINQIATAVHERFSEGLARKFNSAALRKWEKSGRGEPTEGEKAKAAVEEAPKPARQRRAPAKPRTPRKTAAK